MYTEAVESYSRLENVVGLPNSLSNVSYTSTLSMYIDMLKLVAGALNTKFVVMGGTMKPSQEM